jgi:hypothetical protein
MRWDATVIGYKDCDCLHISVLNLSLLSLSLCLSFFLSLSLLLPCLLSSYILIKQVDWRGPCGKKLRVIPGHSQ